MPITDRMTTYDIASSHKTVLTRQYAAVFYWLSLMVMCLGLLTLSPGSTAKERIMLCAEKNLYPFVYLNGYKAAGILRDIAKSIATELDIKVRIKPMRWRKCLDANKNGEVDGILGAGYTDERNTYMQYPGSDGNPDTSQAIWAPIYSVVTSSAQAFTYNGNPRIIPTPVRVPKGFFVAKFLRKDGVEVRETETGDQPNLIELSAKKQGSVVMLRLLAVALSEKSFFKGNLTISDTPYTQTHFYLPFSRKSGKSPELRERIWEAIKRKHEDKAFIQQTVDKTLESY